MNISKKAVDEESLEFNDPPKIVWIKVSDAIGLTHKAKIHDMGGLIQSIEKYGFQELPKWDSKLQIGAGSAGGIKAGNGRIEALSMMESDGKYKLPRGLAVDKESGAWCFALLVGTEAKTRAEALAYFVDSNNLTMAGGNFDMYDIAKMWERDAYIGILSELSGEMPPVTMDSDDIAAYLATVSRDGGGGAVPPKFKEYDETLADGMRICRCSTCGNEHADSRK